MIELTSEIGCGAGFDLTALRSERTHFEQNVETPVRRKVLKA